MRKIEQTKSDMVEIYQKVIYPGLGCAAMVELQMQSLEVLKKELVEQVENKELRRVLAYEIDKITKSMKMVKDTMNQTMGEALIGFAPMEFVEDMKNIKIGG